MLAEETGMLAVFALAGSMECECEVQVNVTELLFSSNRSELFFRHFVKVFLHS